jgi:carbonic anhydrase/acetyltransferase-like protein (isoleucine patch superfamily)
VAVYALGDLVPEIHPDAFVHPQATVIGDVRIGAGSSVWPSAVLRADYGSIVIGLETSVQDGSIVHSHPFRPTLIGDRCVIGHLAHLEACTVEDGCLVGNGSIVLHGAVIRGGALVGSGAVVPDGMEVPSGAMALGIPAKLRLDCVDPAGIALAAAAYVDNAARYRKELRQLD